MSTFMNLFRNKLVLFFGAIFLAFGGIVFGAGFVGYQMGVHSPKAIVVQEFKNLDATDHTAIDFNTFWQAWDKLKKDHVDGAKVQDKDLFYASIKGLVSGLNDPYTVFFPPVESKTFVDNVRGKFGGIGAEIGKKDGFVVVIAPLKGTPAERAGIRAGDKILKVDGKDTTDWDIAEAVDNIRGDVGAKVVLNIYRDGWKKPADIEIIRAEIMVPTLDWELKDGHIAYIRLYGFNENALPLFEKAVREASAKKVDSIVLDLRNNPGGFLDTAVSLAGWFVEPGKAVVSERFRSGQETVYQADGNGALKNIPTVVLINEGSASASEILAGALRDDRGIKLIGEKSFGKGTVQQLDTLVDGSELKITIARWFTPSGISIDKNGLKPDIEVKVTDDDIAKKQDPQLAKALDTIKSELTGSSANK